jgi:FkbM family methyltransferase
MGDTVRLRLVSVLAAGLDGVWFRGKGRVLEALCPRAGIVDRSIFGVPMRLNLGDHIQRRMFLGVYEPEPTRLVREYLRPGMIVVDVGANVGYYTLLALSRVGQRGRVVAIEPAERPRARLAAAVAGAPNATVLACAIGARQGSGTLYVDRETDNDSPVMVPNHGGRATAVSVTTLDACLTDLEIHHVDLLKLDVEGWEPQVLAGARAFLAAGAIRAILCELNDYWLRSVGTSAAALRRQLADEGFRDVARRDRNDALQTLLFLRQGTGWDARGRPS